MKNMKIYNLIIPWLNINFIFKLVAISFWYKAF